MAPRAKYFTVKADQLALVVFTEAPLSEGQEVPDTTIYGCPDYRTYLFSTPKGLDLKFDAFGTRIAQGLEVAGPGAEISVPPTENYVVISDAAVAPAPDWLIRDLLA